MAHEIGHALGLFHDREGCASSVMSKVTQWDQGHLRLRSGHCELANRLNDASALCVNVGDPDEDACERCRRSLGGTVEGLADGERLQLSAQISAGLANSTISATASGSGDFTFPDGVLEGAGYQVGTGSVSNPDKTCQIASGGSGTVADQDIADVRITCECTNLPDTGGVPLLAGLAEDCDLPDRGELFDEKDVKQHVVDLCFEAPWMCGPGLNPWWWYASGPPTGAAPCQRETVCSSRMECKEWPGLGEVCGEVMDCNDQCVASSASQLSGPLLGVDDTGTGPASGTLRLTGVAHDTDGLYRLWVYVDGVRVPGEQVVTGMPRPEVCGEVSGDCDPSSGFAAEIDTSQLTDGTHRIDVVALDADQEYGMGTRITRQITVDNACTGAGAPFVSLDLPLDGSTVRGTILLRAAAGIADPSDAAVERVLFYLDGHRIGTDWTAPYEHSLDTTTLSDGLHAVSARVRDTCGGLADVPPATVEVANANDPPRVELEQPFSGTEVAGTAVAVSGWALDEDGIASVGLRLTGQVVTTSSATVPRPEICTAFGEIDPGCPDVGWSLAFDSTAFPDGPYTLKVVVTDGRGGTASVSRPMEIRNRPPLPPGTSVPQSTTAALGDPVTFRVTAYGEGPFTYRWQVREGQRWLDLVEGEREGRVTGVATDALTLTGLQYADAGGYRCRVSNAGGTTASVSASLTVVETLEAPTVTTGIDQVVTEGDAATLTVAATGIGPITYQWQAWNGVAWIDLADDLRVSGARTDTLRIGGTTFDDAGRHRCLATNGGGTSPSQEIRLTVQPDLTGSCVAGPTALCLGQDRFRAEAVINGSPGQALTYSDLGGFFTLNNPDNVEVAVKVVDGTSVNGRYWVFHGSATSLSYTLTVTDTVTDAQKTYFKEEGSFCGTADTAAFEDPAAATGDSLAGATGIWLRLEAGGGHAMAGESTVASCEGSSTALCLLENRFRAEVWKDGAAQRAVPVTGLSGAFTFGSSANPEVVVKVLDGTPVNDWYWVFFGSLTSQIYEVRVTDTTDGTLRTYPSPGTTCGGADTTAF